MPLCRETMTLVLPIPPDEIYMTLIDVECHSLLTGWEMEMDPSPGGIYRSEGGEIEGIVHSLNPADRIVFDLRIPELTLEEPIRVDIFLEPIDDGTRIFFHHLKVPKEVLETWRSFWKESYVEPLALFFDDDA
jgi:activator of HSP90 ATPase